jgi:hypothetical protein
MLLTTDWTFWSVAFIMAGTSHILNWRWFSLLRLTYIISVIKTQIWRAHDAFPGRLTFIGYAQCLKMGNPNNLKVLGRKFTDKTVRRPTSRSTLEHILTQTNQSAHTHTAWLLETRHQTRDLSHSRQVRQDLHHRDRSKGCEKDL